MHKWHEKYIISSCARVPPKPGVYLIGHVRKINGLERSRNYIYIGETNNLKRRLQEHSPIKEPKDELRDYIKKHLGDIKCWYCTLPKAKAKEEQDFLIKELSPRFNIQLNTQRKKP